MGCTTSQSALAPIQRDSTLPNTKVFINGATGYAGQPTLAALAARGYFDVTVATRDVAKNSDKIKAALPSANVVQVADDKDQAAVVAAMDGAEVVVVIPPGSEDRGEIATRYVQAAAHTASVKHIILLSVPFASERSDILFQRQFAGAEAAIKACGKTYTILEMDFFLENMFGMAAGIKASKKVYMHLGVDGWFAGSSVQDFAECVAAIAANCKAPAFKNKTFVLTSDDKNTGADIARMITEVTQSSESYEYVNVTDRDAVIGAFKSLGMPDWQAEGVFELLDMYAHSKGPAPSGHVQQITGKKPTSLMNLLVGGAAMF